MKIPGERERRGREWSLMSWQCCDSFRWTAQQFGHLSILPQTSVPSRLTGGPRWLPMCMCQFQTTLLSLPLRNMSDFSKFVRRPCIQDAARRHLCGPLFPQAQPAPVPSPLPVSFFCHSSTGSLSLCLFSLPFSHPHRIPFSIFSTL